MFDVNWIRTNTKEQLSEVSKNKKVIFWGAGNEAKRVLSNELAGAEITISYFCDNSEEKWEKQFLGHGVCPPETLKSEKSDDIVVVICCRYFLMSEIIGQLEGYGVTNYFASILFADETRNKYIARFDGEYVFADRRKHSKKLLVVLTGYKEFLWDTVFQRIAAFVPDDLDVCLVLSGKENDTMRELAAQQGWSYLSTKQNKLSLAQNIAISLHSEAQYIFKLDEDMFIGRDYFTDMERSFHDIKANSLCRIGFLSPMIPVNVFSYLPFLNKLGLEGAYKKKFGKEVISQGAWALHYVKEVNEFLWENSLPFDAAVRRIKSNNTECVTCPYRFSIGAILFERRLWEQMIGFETGAEGELGNDEAYICDFCMELFLAIYVDTNIFAGHLSYGGQTEYMKGYYLRHRELFEIQKNIKGEI
jgi:hypothetical protein